MKYNSFTFSKSNAMNLNKKRELITLLPLFCTEEMKMKRLAEMRHLQEIKNSIVC